MTDPAVASAIYWLSWLEPAKTWAEVGVAVFLAVGVILSFIASPLSKKVDRARESEIARLFAETTAAKSEIAKANAEAAQANLEIERLRAPRHLSEAASAQFVDAMRSFAGQRASFGALPPTFEASAFSEQLVSLLKKAGIDADINQGAEEMWVGSARGVVARYFSISDKGKAFAEAFSKELLANGIRATSLNGLMGNLPDKTRTPSNTTDAYWTWVVVAVGDKE